MLTRFHLQNGAVRTAEKSAVERRIGTNGAGWKIGAVMGRMMRRRRRRRRRRVRRNDALSVAVDAESAAASASASDAAASASDHHAWMRIEVVWVAVVGTLGLGQLARQLLTLAQSLLLLALEPLLLVGW